MDRYAKLIEGSVEFAPKNKGSIINYDLDVEAMIADGYKLFIPAEIPITNRMYHYEYVENTDNITEVVVYDETQEEADARELKNAKETKYSEALIKANDFAINGSVEYKNCEFEMSTSNRNNLRDTEEALRELGQQTTIWNDKNDVLVELTVDELKYIRLNLILARIQQLWIVQYPHYKDLIEEASTVEQVNNIDIDYSVVPNEE